MMRKAFSLIELSIVILIIGFLVAAVTVGQSLIKQSELRQVISDVESFKASIQTYYASYNQLPGDTSNATVFFSATDNGNGDGEISTFIDTAGTGFSEAGRVFEHLSKAEIYSGQFTPGSILSDAVSPNRSLTPQGPKGGYYLIHGCTFKGMCRTFTFLNSIGGTSKNVISFGKLTTDQDHSTVTAVGQGVFTIEEIRVIEGKIDDGLARSGSFTGHNGGTASGALGEECLIFSNGVTHDPSLDRGGASYNIGSDFMCNASFNTSF